MAVKWYGVMPAITTCFDEDLKIDHEFAARHVKWLVENGCTGIVCNGSLGEGSTLSLDEKIALWTTCVGASALATSSTGVSPSRIGWSSGWPANAG